MSRQATPWWSDQSKWLWGLRTCTVGLVLADVSVGHPSPGLHGEHLVLLIGMVLAALAWLAWLPPGRTDDRVIVVVLGVGMVGGCVASVVSPNNVAVALPAVISMLAGTSLPFPHGAGVAACGLVTLGAGFLILTHPGFSLLGSSLAVVGGLVFGLWRRQYLLRVEQAELVTVETQRAEAEHVRAQVLDERVRIAREIHDILAHTLGGLVVQLDAADALLGEGADPDQGRQLVGGARHLAVEGLEETRQAIAALRADSVAMPEALATLASGHTQVSHTVRGSPRELGPDAGLALYRTAQEALTNARKHAPGAPVEMTLCFEEKATVLRITNRTPPGSGDGHPSPLAATGGGYGLSGLSERAELLGGTLHAGPSEEGWVVELRVPA